MAETIAPECTELGATADEAAAVRYMLAKYARLRVTEKPRGWLLGGVTFSIHGPTEHAQRALTEIEDWREEEYFRRQY